MPGHVLIAPDKFKGSLTAPGVAEAVADGMRRVRADVDVQVAPVADGGDGTVSAAIASGYRRVPVRVTGPVGEPVDAEIAVDGDTAVVELASASGLAMLDPARLAPMTATSAGTGELVRAALDEGAHTIVLGVGGSACTDGGAGMLGALGARLLAADGSPLPPGGGALAELDKLDLGDLDPRLNSAEVVLASDVDNPLLGPKGAAHVYGPQKGADPAQVEQLDAALARWAHAVSSAGCGDVSGHPGAGAAGGVGFAAIAVLGARRRPGTDVVLDLVGFDRRLAGARLVVTGEGSLDEQTLHGKAPAGVASRASTAGVPVVAVAGRCLLPAQRLHDAGFAAAYALADVEPDPERSMREGAELLVGVGERIAREWL
ncbi:glycerate kinase [Saccharopolyspora erythraea NRRL 2338]|uniref:Glycerate kinase n=2 Tax=Saccharopolyspora erythraea TaxID=1836 RepID=A4FPB9_SACEN|nr:glycerate kinase [Saccharopolyspora erythraea]EQD86692.1 glycerate kinase [Saccharopolyspora erythraea D]PFG99535.1 glycerate kinase [Saccharopolyspora erythraea NRRL 2338]CAM05894.1 putative glycerate kinase [Saccharopolyspora erythraea NRRL 2338]